MATTLGTWGMIQAQFKLAAGLEAYLDWASGIIRVNATVEKWVVLTALSGDEQRSQEADSMLLETITHEQTHVLQIVTTGYLYSFAVNLFHTIQDWVAETAMTFEGSTDDRVQRLLTTAIPEELVQRVHTLSQALDMPGPQGLSIRAIVESAAFLVQKLAWSSEINGEQYRTTLDRECPAPEYRAAYDVAFNYLGEDALLAFPWLSSLALCTDNPPQAFIHLCGRSASLGLARQGILKSSQIASLLDNPDWRVIGTAAEAAASLPDEHPVYSETVKRLNDLHAQGQLSLDTYMISPSTIAKQLDSEIARPMLFNEVAGRYLMEIPRWLWPDLPKEEREAKVKSLAVIAAIHSRVLLG